MTKETKIILSVIADIILIVAINCAYGFIVGGSPKALPYTLFLIASSIVISLLTFIFIFGKDFASHDKLKSFAIGFAFAVGVISYFSYGLLNEIATDPQNSIEYETTITYVDYIPKSITDDVYFYDLDGNEICIKYTPAPIQISEDEFIAEEGAKIVVRETNGAFEYKTYKILGYKE